MKKGAGGGERRGRIYRCRQSIKAHFPRCLHPHLRAQGMITVDPLTTESEIGKFSMAHIIHKNIVQLKENW